MWYDVCPLHVVASILWNWKPIRNTPSIERFKVILEFHLFKIPFGPSYWKHHLFSRLFIGAIPSSGYGANSNLQTLLHFYQLYDASSKVHVLKEWAIIDDRNTLPKWWRDTWWRHSQLDSHMTPRLNVPKLKQQPQYWSLTVSHNISQSTRYWPHKY